MVMEGGGGGRRMWVIWWLAPHSSKECVTGTDVLCADKRDMDQADVNRMRIYSKELVQFVHLQLGNELPLVPSAIPAV